MTKKKIDEYTFRSKDFYELLDKQKYKCPVSGRELTPENTTAEHIQPLRLGGNHCKNNIYLIDKDVAKLKRYMDEKTVIKLAADIIQTRGSELGYGLRKKKN